MKSPFSDLDKIRHDCLTLFEQSIGFEFRVKGTPITAICKGVDWKFMHVESDYGNFHIDLCELTGKEKPQPEN